MHLLNDRILSRPSSAHLKRLVGLGMGLGVRPLLLTRLCNEGEKHCCLQQQNKNRDTSLLLMKLKSVDLSWVLVLPAKQEVHQHKNKDNSRELHLLADPSGRGRGRGDGHKVNSPWRRRRRLLQIVVALQER